MIYVLIIIVSVAIYIFSLLHTLYILLDLDLYDEFKIFDHLIESMEIQINLYRILK